MQDPITIHNGTTVERTDALESIQASKSYILGRLTAARTATLSAAQRLAGVKASGEYFALLTDEQLEAADHDKVAWSMFYQSVGLNASKVSRLLQLARVVGDLEDAGVPNATAVSQDTAKAIDKAINDNGKSEVMDSLKAIEGPMTTTAVRNAFKVETDKVETDKVETNEVETDKVEGRNTPTDTPTVEGFNDRVAALEAAFKSDKPIDHDSVDYDAVRELIADLTALLANEPS